MISVRPGAAGAMSEPSDIGAAEADPRAVTIGHGPPGKVRRADVWAARPGRRANPRTAGLSARALAEIRRMVPGQPDTVEQDVNQMDADAPACPSGRELESPHSPHE